jgi:hypothetical protein
VVGPTLSGPRHSVPGARGPAACTGFDVMKESHAAPGSSGQPRSSGWQFGWWAPMEVLLPLADQVVVKAELIARVRVVIVGVGAAQSISRPPPRQ